MEMLNEMIMPIVLIACLIVGYVFKKWLPADNKYIPTVLAVLGAVLGCVAMKTVALEPIVYGALSGLASTGLHQLFTQYIEKGDEK